MQADPQLLQVEKVTSNFAALRKSGNKKTNKKTEEIEVIKSNLYKRNVYSVASTSWLFLKFEFILSNVNFTESVKDVDSDSAAD